MVSDLPTSQISSLPLFLLPLSRSRVILYNTSIHPVPPSSATIFRNPPPRGVWSMLVIGGAKSAIMAFLPLQGPNGQICQFP